MNKQEFYEHCATLLDVHYTHNTIHDVRETASRDGTIYTPTTMHSRWGPRAPGNGRFEGHGVIRYFNSQNIQVMLHTPDIHKMCGSHEEVFELLR